MASRLNLARMGAVILGASTALMFAALPASADGAPHAPATPATHASAGSPAAPQDTVTGVQTGKTKGGGQVWITDTDGKNKSEPAELIGLKVGQQTDWMYCIELTVESKGGGTTLTELPWAQFPSTDTDSQFVKNAGKVNWILHDSYPSVDSKTLAAEAGAAGLTDNEAIEATQAAIWHFSNNISIDTTVASKKNQAGNPAAVIALYNFLVNKATDLPQPTSTNPSITIDKPSSTKGTDGSLIGPFTIHSNLGTPLALGRQLVDGVTLSDANGKTITAGTVNDGDKVYFDVAKGTKDSAASFTVNGQQDVGQMFAGQDIAQAAAKPGGVRANCTTQPSTQTLIVAQSTPVTATASASWTEQVTTTVPPTSSTAPTTTQPVVAPTTTTTPAAVATGGGSGSLPFTGVSLILPVGLAVILIGAGATFLIMQRKRRRV